MPIHNPTGGNGGTISTQNANAVDITGGTIDGTTIGATTPAPAAVTTLKMTSGTPGTGKVATSDASGNATWENVPAGTVPDSGVSTTALLSADGAGGWAVEEPTGTGAPVRATSPTVENPTYSGTFTGGTGIVNIGSGQIYKAADGKVGIGTATPDGPFEIIGDSSTGKVLAITGNNHHGQSLINRVKLTADVNYGVTYVRSQRISDGAACLTLWTSTGGTPSEKARIFPTGNVTIGSTTDAAKLNVDNTADTLSLRVDRAGTTVTNSIAEFVSNVTAANTTHCKIMCDGDLENTNNSYGALSDRKLKENIVAASPKLAKLLKTKIHNFNFIGSDLKQLGVIADELEQVFPGLVKHTPDTETVPDPDWTPKTLTRTVTEPVTKTRTKTEIVERDGQFVQVVTEEEYTEDVPVMLAYPVYDEAGNQLFTEQQVGEDEEGNPVMEQVPVIHQVPVTEEYTEPEENRPTITRLTGTTTASVKYSVFVPMLILALQELCDKIGVTPDVA